MAAHTEQSRNLRLTYAALLAPILLFTLYEELHLRRRLFHAGGVSALIAGSLPNFLGAVLGSLAIMVLKPEANRGRIFIYILSVVLGLTLYEFAQIRMPHQVFDWNDIVATFMGGIAAWLIIALPRLAHPQSASAPQV